MNLAEMSKTERSLLLYLETCVVDHGGLMDMRRVNEEEMKIIDLWAFAGFIVFSRLIYKDVIKTSNSVYTNAVVLTDKAFTLAHEERRARAARMYEKRIWKTTDEV